MSIEIIVPTLGESVTEAIVAKWFKAAGDGVTQDEVIVELETDKVNLEVTAETHYHIHNRSITTLLR